MSTIESYGGVSADGGVGGGGGSVHNNNNSGPPASGLMNMNMRLGFSPDGGAAVYKPLMPPNSSPSATPTPPAAYQPSGGGDGSAASGAATPSTITPSTGEPTKRKRGRPRKYSVDGTMASPALTSPPPPHVQQQPPPPPQTGLHSGGFSPPAPTAATQPTSTGKKRGRPPGSGRKQQAANEGTGLPGANFTPHVITVKAGEDVASRIVSFSQNGTQTVSILSANGSISNVTLRQSTSSGGTVTYEGRFEILSLHGTYTLVENGGQRSRSGGLTVVLAGPDGRVLGGNVAGLLVAATPVQVVVACFVVGQDLKQPIQADPLSAYPKFVPGSSGAASSASRGTLSESSGGPGSPHNQSTEACNNNIPQDMNTYAWQ